jgi:hypothetical protein
MLTGIVSTGSTSSTVSPTTRDTGFDGDPVSDLEPGDTFTDGNDLSGGFVSRAAFVGDDHGGSDLTVFPEMNIGAAADKQKGRLILARDAREEQTKTASTHPQIPVALTLNLTSPGPGSA